LLDALINYVEPCIYGHRLFVILKLIEQLQNNVYLKHFKRADKEKLINLAIYHTYRVTIM